MQLLWSAPPPQCLCLCLFDCAPTRHAVLTPLHSVLARLRRCLWPAAAACSWLRPYPNGALPLLQIRNTLVELLALMNLDTSNDYTREKLEQSELGKIVMFYEKNPHDKTSELLSLDLPAGSLLPPPVMLTVCWAVPVGITVCCASACIVQASMWRWSCVGNS